MEHECEEGELMLVKRLALKNFRGAAVAAFNHPLLRNHLIEKFYTEAKKELKGYSKSNSTVFRFDTKSFETLAAYRSVDLMEECKLKTPITYGFVKSTSRKSNPSSVESKEALALSALLNTWIPSSKFVYRNNVILTAGGCKGPEVKAFHKLGKTFLKR